jgi:hypothetical protein
MRQSTRSSALLILAPWLLLAPERSVSLQELLARQAAAHGGAMRTRAVQSLCVRLRIQEPGFTVFGRYLCDRAGRVRVDISADGKVVYAEGLDESGAWQMGSDGAVRAASPDGMAALEHGRLFNLYGLEELPQLGHNLVIEGRETLAGGAVDIVRVELSDGFRTWRGIDVTTGRITLERDHRALHPDADPRPRWLETRLSDFRMVEGLLFPFLSVQSDRDTAAWLGTTQILEVEVNPCLDDPELHRPASAFRRVFPTLESSS